MKIKLPKSMKQKIKAERAKVFEGMSRDGLSKKDWDDLNEKYTAYSDMLKPTWTVTPDTLLVVGGNLAGILLILNFEKFDLVRSKALSFVLKGRV